MCDSNVGVTKRIELEKISKQIAKLAEGLEEEVKVDVSEIRNLQRDLESVIRGGKAGSSE